MTARIPQMMYGTAWKQNRTEELVNQAITCGFRGIDTACQPKHYQEDQVGDAIRNALRTPGIERHHLFIQTKFTSVGGQDQHRMPYDMDATLSDQVRASIATSLKNLSHGDDQSPYLDCVLLHSPFSDFSDTLEAWRVLESYVPDRIKTLGISNVYHLNTLKDLYENAAVKPAIVQNRFSKQTSYGGDIRTFCLEKEIVFQSFWTLSANTQLLSSNPVTTVAREVNITPAAALYNLVIGLKVTVLNGTTSCERMHEDLSAMQAMKAWAEKNPGLHENVQKEFQHLLEQLARESKVPG